MKLAIDLRPLQLGHQHRGIGAYILNLLQRLPTQEDVDYIFMRYDTSDPIKDFNIEIEGKYQEVVVKKPVFGKQPSKLIAYGLAGLVPNYRKLKRHKPDVFFQPYYLLGAPKIRGCRVVTVAYDVIPLIFKQIYLPKWSKNIGFGQLRIRSRVRLVLRSWYYEKKFNKGSRLLRNADQVISISDSTKQDLVKIVGVDSDKVTTIYPAASFRKAPGDDVIRPKIKQIIDEIDAPFACYIGATDRRRQVDELVFGFNLYNARIGKLGLMLCGNEFEPKSKEINDGAKNAIEMSSYGETLKTLGKVTEAEKKYILTKAAVFVYPTLYEGFGLPIVEAMSCGTPIISYRNSSIPEIAQDYPTYTEKMNGFSIFIALRDVLNNGGPTEADIKQAKNRADSFNWDDSAEQTWHAVLSA